MKNTIKTAELQKLSGLSESMLRQLAAHGEIPPPSRGEWPEFETIQRLINHYRRRGTTPLDEQRLLKLRAETELAEIERDQARARLIPISAVEGHMSRVFHAIKSGILASGLSRPEQNDLLLDLKRLVEGVANSGADEKPVPTEPAK